MLGLLGTFNLGFFIERVSTGYDPFLGCECALKLGPSNSFPIVISAPPSCWNSPQLVGREGGGERALRGADRSDPALGRPEYK